jgi:hypothetical protein
MVFSLAGAADAVNPQSHSASPPLKGMAVGTVWWFCDSPTYKLVYLSIRLLMLSCSISALCIFYTGMWSLLFPLRKGCALFCCCLPETTVAEDGIPRQDADLMISCIFLDDPVERASKKKIAFYCCLRPESNALCQIFVKTQMMESNPDCLHVRLFSMAFE